MPNKIATMIENNQLKIEQFFIMHPFAIHEKQIYEEALSDLDFIKELYVESNKTYERLATLSNIIDNLDKNLLVITGYRGCGKTNFVKFVQNLAEGKHGLVPMEETIKYQLRMATEPSMQKEVREAYKISKDRIFSTFFEVKANIESIIDGQEFVEYLERKISSKVEYINFDEITLQSRRPIDEALYHKLRWRILERMTDGSIRLIADTINSFVTQYKWYIEEGFEEIDYKTLRPFWKDVKEYLYLIENENDIEVLFEEMHKLKLEQILFVMTVFDYAEMIVTGVPIESQRLLYILDNIDIISDNTTDVFQKSIDGVWKYLWDSRNVYRKIAVKDPGNPFIQLFKNTNVIVVMRETTAMHITGHLRDKMRDIMDHFDMSPDIYKNLVLQKRLNLARRLIEKGDINNKQFVEAIDLLRSMTSHDIFMKDLFALFNNDYRTAIGCIVTILKENLSEFRKAVNLLESTDPMILNGGKGIIYRLLFEGFYGWQYFDGLGIPSRRSPEGQALIKNRDVKYSVSRVLLTVLIKRQVKVPERFFVNPEETMRFSDLYETLESLIDLDDLIMVIDKLYGLSNRKFWNHLLTFDNIFQYTSASVKKYVEEKKKNPSLEDIYIRPTLAGQVFVELISPHFEFFACRYALNKPYSIFHYQNIDNDTEFRGVTAIINDVYNMVAKCTENLESYNRAVLDRETGAESYKDIVGSEFFFQSQFHEERIIHTHITYLESYRKFIGTLDPPPNRYEEINDFLLNKIKAYLELLRYDVSKGIKRYREVFISENSKQLYNQLNVCIEKIKEKPSISRKVEVTRDYYLGHYKDQLCKEMVMAGDEYVG